MRNDGLSVERYFKVARTRVGDLRSDRPTVPILGSLFTPDNNYRLSNALEYGLKSISEVSNVKKLYWLIPNVKWGNTQVLPLTLDLIKDKVLKKADVEEVGIQEPKINGFECIALMQNHTHQPHIKKAFSSQHKFNDNSSIPPSLEILYIPNILVACLVHAPIMVNQGHPVPLGFLSFDPNVINRTQSLIDALIA